MPDDFRRARPEARRGGHVMHDVMSGVKLTYDDLRRLPDDNLRHELIDGEHYVAASPSTRHQLVLGNLYYALRTWLQEHSGGELYLAPVDVVLSLHDVVVPDLLYVAGARVAHIVTPEAIRGVPDLIVEVLSPSTRRVDSDSKLALYDRAGAVEYWIVDPQRERVRVYRRENAGLAVAGDVTARARDVLATPLLPGLQIPLATLFH
jgi:Uma2 family endonuclease